MSRLLDDLIDMKNNSHTEREIDGRWYKARPLDNISLRLRVKDAWAIIRCKGHCYHYKEEE